MKKILLNFLWIPIFSFSQYGVLDTDFGENGISIHEIEIPLAHSQKMKTDVYGNIYILGSYFEFEEQIGETGADLSKFFLMKLFPDGSLDNSFGENGYVKYEIPNGWTWAQDLGLIDDDKILIAGNYEQYSDWSDEKSNVFFMKFNLDGSLDVDFGENGLYMDPFRDYRFVRKLIVKEDTFFVLENSTLGEGFYIEKRFLNGQLDFNFGIAGQVAFLNGGLPNAATDFTLNNQNEMYIIHEHGNINRDYIKKLNSEGGLVNEIYYSHSDMSSRSVTSFQDKIFLSGIANDNFAIKSFNQDLTLNEFFGVNGMVEKNLGFEEHSAVNLVIGENGRLTQIGYVKEGNNHHFGLAGYYSNGGFDNTFGINGVTSTDVTNDNYDAPIQSMLVAPDKLLVLKSGGLGLVQYTIYEGLSVEDVSVDSKIQIAPNPASNSFVINGLNEDQSQVQILDLSGKLIREFNSVENNQILNLGAIPKGTYIAKIKSKNKLETKKLIVK